MANVIYLTGFGPFQGIDENPTADVVDALAGESFGKLKVVGEVLPTSYERGPLAALAGIREHAPKIIVHLGLTLADTVVRVESWAVNEMTARIPDVDGAQPWELPITDEQERQSIYETEVDAEAIVEDLRAAGHPARVSLNAGRFVCNCVYFHTLDFAAGGGTKAPAIFAHLPALGLRPFGDLEQPAWDYELLTEAARSLLTAMARRHG